MSFSTPCRTYQQHMATPRSPLREQFWRGRAGLREPTCPSVVPGVLGWRVERTPSSLLHVPGPRTELRAGRPRKESGQNDIREMSVEQRAVRGWGEKDGDSLCCSWEVLKTAQH